MQTILVLLKNILILTFRKKSNIIVFLIVPVVSIIVSMSLYSNTGSGALKIGIIDKDNSVLSRDMTKAIDINEKFETINIHEEKINSEITSGNIDCAVIMPSGFEKDVYSNLPVEVEVVSLKGEEVTIWIKNFTNLYITNLVDINRAAGGDPKIFKRIYEGFKSEGLKLEVTKLEDRGQSRGITMQSIGFLIMFMMLGSSFTAALILKEKRERTYFRICCAPVSSRIYIISNVLASLIIVLIQVMAVLVVATGILGIKTYVPMHQMAAILMTFGLVSIGIGLMVVSFSKTTTQANNLSTLIITPSCMIGGCFWPPSMMPGVVQKLSNFVPQKWAIDAISKIQMGSSFSGVLTNIVILIAFALTFFLISIYMFNNKNDIKNFV
jgi:ABC-2 type transport system permease protein